MVILHQFAFRKIMSPHIIIEEFLESTETVSTKSFATPN